MVARKTRGVPKSGLAAVMILGLLPGVALADDDGADPMAGWQVVEDGDLATLSGREGVVVQLGEQDFDITSNGRVEAKEMTSGVINFNESLGNMHGIFTQLNNTGNGALNQNGTIVNVNVH